MSLIRKITGLSIPLKIGAAVLLLVALIWTYNFVDDFFSKEAETRAELSQNQATAAIDSGKDAVETTNRVSEKITERFYTTERVIENVQQAPDFDTAHAIGVDSLCLNSDLCVEE